MGKECSSCGWLNDDAAESCESCGFAFAETAAIQAVPKIVLISMTKEKLVVPENGCLIGRECNFAQDIFNHKWVSDTHCEISVIDGECYI